MVLYSQSIHKPGISLVMHKIIRYILFILLITVIFIDTVSAAVERSWLDNRIKSFVKDKPIKAMIYGLWINGKPISINAIGESMTDVQAYPGMHYRIGGITETMLTAILMRLVEENKIKLDDPVSRWYPSLPNASRVTLKMLASCTSGYPDYVYNQKFVDAVLNHPFKSWSSTDLIAYGMMNPPRFQSGTNQFYSHTDFVILGSILTKVTNKNMHDLMREYIFTKVGMKDSEFSLNALIQPPVLHAFSQDRNVYEDSTYWDPSWTSYSGAVVSNITDLGKWANAWMTKGLLSQKSLQILRAPDTAGLGKNTSDIYFAMGFAVINHWLVQNPSFGGYSGVFAVLPEKNIVFIAVNTLNESKQPDNTNYSVEFMRELASELAPDYPIPRF